TGEDTAFDGFLDAVLDSRDVFPGNGPANNLVFNLDAFATFVWFEGDTGMAVLAASTRLADEFAFAFGGFGDGFAVSDLRRASVGLDFILPEQPVADNFEVK